MCRRALSLKTVYVFLGYQPTWRLCSQQVTENGLSSTKTNPREVCFRLLDQLTSLANLNRHALCEVCKLNNLGCTRTELACMWKEGNNIHSSKNSRESARQQERTKKKARKLPRMMNRENPCRFSKTPSTSFISKRWTLASSSSRSPPRSMRRDATMRYFDPIISRMPVSASDQEDLVPPPQSGTTGCPDGIICLKTSDDDLSVVPTNALFLRLSMTISPGMGGKPGVEGSSSSPLSPLLRT